MISITQRCDRCGKVRDLKVGYHGGLSTIKSAARLDGWRAVQEFKHLCPPCIKVALEPPK